MSPLELSRPALGRDALELVLNNPERKSGKARLLDLPPMGIGVEAVVADHDLALVGDVGGHPGDELRIVHPLQLSCAFPISVADLKNLLTEWTRNGGRSIAVTLTQKVDQSMGAGQMDRGRLWRDVPYFAIQSAKVRRLVYLRRVVLLATIYRLAIFRRLIVGYFDHNRTLIHTASSIARRETDHIDPAIAIP